MKKFFLLLFVVSNLCFSQIAGKIPSRVILNLTTEPYNSIAVTWRTQSEVKEPMIQFAEETDSIDIAKYAGKVPAKTEKLGLDSVNTVYHYSAILKYLKPSTKYVYRVGGDSIWNEWNSFTTARKETTPFEFVFFGDPQVGFRDYLPRVFRNAYLKAPNAGFWLYTGDITDVPKQDYQWEDLFYSLNFMPKNIPSVMVPGNHEYAYHKKDLTKKKGLTYLWRPHFTLPENGPESLNETSYWFDYQGVRFIMINGQDKLAEQAEWMDKVLANNPNKWTIAAVHQPAFSMGAERDERKIRDTIMPLFDKYNVDLVLTGHDHVYSRSYKLKNGKIVKNNQKGTVYVVSVSGIKQYTLHLKYKDLMVKYAGNISLFQVISINNKKLTYKSYTASGNLFDSFELVK